MGRMKPDLVHPQLPRVAQAVTGVLSVVALLLQDHWVILVALALVVLALVAPRWSLVTILFRALAPAPSTLEPVAPVRFSQRLAAGALTAGFVLIVAGADTVGWVVIGLVAVMALVSAITGFCVGCAVYRLILRGRSADGDVRELIGLTGSGPWVVVLTAPGCARCEPVARQVESTVPDGAVVRVDLSRTPAATRLPVASIPAILTVDSDGRVAHTATGSLRPADITRFVQSAGLASAAAA